jgi:hypothetical protein
MPSKQPQKGVRPQETTPVAGAVRPPVAQATAMRNAAGETYAKATTARLIQGGRNRSAG